MIFVREFEATDGFIYVDHGETPDDQILNMGCQWIADNDGNEVMRRGGSDQHIAEVMASLVSGNVLEIGYGLGLAFKVIRSIVPTHDVIDLDPDVYTLAKAHWPGRYDEMGQRLIGDFNTATLGTYDTVLCDATMDFYSQRSVLDRLRSLVRPNGYFIPRPLQQVSRRIDLERLPGFRIDATAPFDWLDGDVDYEHRIRNILRHRGQLSRLPVLVAKNERRHRKRGLVGRYQWR